MLDILANIDYFIRIIDTIISETSNLVVLSISNGTSCILLFCFICFIHLYLKWLILDIATILNKNISFNRARWLWKNRQFIRKCIAEYSSEIVIFT